jgi:hypothetical protein
MDSASTETCLALDERVPQALMIPLAVVMRDELHHRSSEVPFAERNHPVETFLLDRPHEPFRIGVRVQSLIRRLHHTNSRLAEPFANRGTLIASVDVAAVCG